MHSKKITPLATACFIIILAVGLFFLWKNSENRKAGQAGGVYSSVAAPSSNRGTLCAVGQVYPSGSACNPARRFIKDANGSLGVNLYLRNNNTKETLGASAQIPRTIIAQGFFNFTNYANKVNGDYVYPNNPYDEVVVIDAIVDQLLPGINDAQNLSNSKTTCTQSGAPNFVSVLKGTANDFQKNISLLKYGTTTFRYDCNDGMHYVYDTASVTVQSYLDPKATSSGSAVFTNTSPLK